ncbi:hypothetical protein VNI00_004874 [Paramarasmius palmivorus]|uniref:HNH nuclease domain-containing protein n=1 Tax=Paramarasmius palmivorus TaxID=297713 RepID=A0AAW0DKK0_9AGAR
MFKWLGLMVVSDPSATSDIQPCEVEDKDLLSYIPVKELGPVAWDTMDLNQPWKPGNYRLAMSHLGGYYGTDRGMGTIADWERRHGTIPLITGHQPTCAIHPQETSPILKTIWIVPPNCYKVLGCDLLNPKCQSYPENLILLPSTLIDDFKENNFTIDVLRDNRIITFPTISSESEALLNSCSLRVDDANIRFLQVHLKISLWQHCMHGDIHAEYLEEIEERIEMIEEGARPVVEDQLDVAVREWLSKNANPPHL